MISKSNCFLETRLYKNQRPFSSEDLESPQTSLPAQTSCIPRIMEGISSCPVLEHCSSSLSPAPLLGSLVTLVSSEPLKHIFFPLFFTPPYTEIITSSSFCHPNSTSFWKLLFPWEFFLSSNWQQFLGTSQLFPSCCLCLAGIWLPRRAPRFPGCSYNNRKLNTHSGDC